MTATEERTVYGDRLLPQHAKLLQDSAVSPDVAAERGYVSVDQKPRLKRLGFEDYQCCVPGLLIPIRNVVGEIANYEYRPDVPRTNRAGKAVKYDRPRDVSNVLDVHPRIRDDLGNPTVPLWITEGVRKADSAITAGLCCIGLNGVYGWRGRNENAGTTALGDWESIALNANRAAYVCFDSDAMTKPEVSDALQRLAKFLRSRGARPHLVYLPDGDNGEKVGLDDYLAAGHTVTDLRALATDQVATDQPPDDDAPQTEDENRERALLRLDLQRGRKRRQDGASFCLDAPSTAESVWGRDEQVLWAKGEPLLINGPTGVGKTTLAQQLTSARLGLRDQVLGFPIAPEERRVLYIAADRPRQAQRSMNRMVAEADREVLAQRLVVWRGPLPSDLARSPELLVVMAEEYDVGTIIIDSLKDVAMKLTDDDVGGRVSQAFQHCMADGIEVLALHHQRKGQAGGGKPNTIDDVYGSTWITAGAGSVLLLWGKPGDAVVELTHLKQPVDTVGPLTVVHSREGESTADQEVDLLDVVRTSNGLTAEGAAIALYRSEKPDRNAIEKARRRLDGLEKRGVVHRDGGARGGAAGSGQARYYATTGRPE